MRGMLEFAPLESARYIAYAAVRHFYADTRYILQETTREVRVFSARTKKTRDRLQSQLCDV